MKKRRIDKTRSTGPFMTEVEPRVLLSADLPGGLFDADTMPTGVAALSDPLIVANFQEWSNTNAAVAEAHELVVIDAATPDYETLLNDLIAERDDGRTFEVVILDADRDGIEQISDLLRERSGLSAVHIISHGSDGSATLGSSVLDYDGLIANAATIQLWGEAFTADGDLLIYGCNLAAGADGRAFTNTLGNLTGADMAASDDLTGHLDLGGDWDLEYQVGDIETAVALSANAQESFEAVLVNPTITSRETVDDDGDGQIDFIRITADVNLNDNFGDLVMTVDGYTVTGYQTSIPGEAGAASDNIFYVALTESGTPDTGVKPTVTVVSNSKLKDGATDPLLPDGGVAATDTAAPVLTSVSSNTPGGQLVLDTETEHLTLVFSEGLSSAPTGAQLEAALDFANGATDIDANLPDIGGGANPITLTTTNVANDTVRVTYNSGNTASSDPLLVDAHTVDVGLGTNLTDADGNTANIASASVTISGYADPGGPYTIAEGDSVNLDASASNPDSLPLTYSWDIDNDSVFGDVTGESPTLSWAQLQSFGIDDDGVHTISVEVSGGLGGTDTDSTTITVDAVNDAPINSVPAAQSTNEGTALVFSTGNSNLISVSDVDVGGSDLKVTLNIDNGTLTLAQMTGLVFTVGDGAVDSTMTFTGTATNINAALDGLSFDPTSDFNGSSTLTVTTDDQGNTGSGSALTDVDTVAITVDAVNDAPVHSAPAAARTPTDVALVFSTENGNQITISDVDTGGASIEVTLSATNGTVTLGDPPRDGTELLINVTTVGDQGKPVAAMDASGNLIVVWEGAGDDVGGKKGIYARRFDADGVALGSEFLVNTTTDNDQKAPAVAIDASGNFVIVWESKGQDDGDGKSGIYAQRFDSNGVAQGSEFLVNTETSGDQNAPVIAMDASGNFVIAWESKGQDDVDGKKGIYAQRYNASGVAQGGEILVNTETALDQKAPAIAMDSSGNFVIAWQSKGQDDVDNKTGIYAQRFNASGVAQGSETLVNTTTLNDQGNPTVAVDGSGNFVIAWESKGQDDGDGQKGVYAQRFDSTLSAIGGEIAINTETSRDQKSPALAMDSAGNFAVFWESKGQDDADGKMGVYGQRFLRSSALTFSVGDGMADTTMTFTGTIDEINRALDGLVFDPTPSFAGTASLQIQTNDLGNTGTGGNLTDDDTILIFVDNVAPVLDATGVMALTDISEDDVSSAGDTVAAIILSAGGDRITDADASALEGVAVIAVDDSNGQWQYNVGSGWTAFGTVSNTSAVLLDASAFVRFVPDADYNGTAGDITFRAWDQTSGRTGDTGADASTTGGSTAFSTATETATLNVGAVEDGPVIVKLAGDNLSYNEGDGAVVIEQSGDAVVSDIDSPDFDGGNLTVSITAGGDITEDVLSIRDEGVGAGQIGFSGGNVTYAGTLIGTAVGGSGGADLVITLNANATGPAVTALVKNITYENVDTDAPTVGERVVRFVVDDGDGAISSTSDATVTVNAVNDAPELDNTGAMTLTEIYEDDADPAGTTVNSIIASAGGDRITDVDAGPLEGIAVTGVDDSNGQWQYDDGGGWTAFGAVSDSNSVLLSGTASIRFVPNADYYGSAGDITFRAWDQTAGTNGQTGVDASINGGATAFSVATETATLTVLVVNDAPTVSLANTTTTFPEDQDTSVAIKVADIVVTDDVLGTNDLSLSGADAALFEIVGTELRLIAGAVLDFETNPDLDVTVEVDDTTIGATPDDAAPLSISITDVNDPPTVSLANTITAFPEDHDTSVAIKVADIVITDDALGTNNLTLSGADAALFEIVGTELRLIAGAVLDFETNPNLDVTVEVDDTTVGATPDDTAPLSISITDVNEPPTVTLANTITTFPEDQDTSVAIKVANIVITDDALGTNNLTLSGADAALFEIVGTELRLIAGAALDFETNPDLDVTVEVDDTTVGATPDDTAPLSISITDVGEPPTVALANAITTFPEDTDTSSAIKIADIVITDDALGTNNLSLSGADAAMFEIVGTELRLVAGAMLDATANPTLDVTVEVDDTTVGATPDDTALLSISIAEINEPPTVVLANAITTFPDDTDTSSAIKVADIIITDDVLGTNNLTLSGADAALFEIVGTELRLVAGAVLDAMANPNLDVTVEVDDLAVGATPDDTALLSISITEINEPPTVVLANAIMTFPDSTDTSSAIRVADIVVTDDALGTNNLSLSGADAAMFQIVGTELQMIAGAVLDATANPILDVTVEVDDLLVGGTPDDTAPLSISIVASNVVPIAVGESISLSEDTTYTAVAGVNDLVMNDSDADGDPLALDVVPIAGPTQGAVTLNADGTFTYVPNPNFNGSDAFTYRISDGNGGFAQATVMITVDAVNDAPVAGSDSYSVSEDNVLTIPAASGLLQNDSDVEGEALTVAATAVSAPSDGVLILNPDGSFTYTPNADFNGTDGFTYEVADASGVVSQATVTIDIGAVNDAPVGVGDNFEAQSGSPLVVGFNTLTSNDVDADGDTLTLVSFTQPSQGALVDNGDGSLTYVPNANFTGVDSFTYTMTDPGGGTSTALVVVNISAIGIDKSADPAPPPNASTPPDLPADDEAAATSNEPVAAEDEPVVAEEEQGSVAGGEETNIPHLVLAGANPANFIAAMTDDDNDRSDRGPAAKFFSDTMRVLGDTLQFEEFSLMNVDLDTELLWEALDKLNDQLSNESTDDVRATFMVQVANGSGVALTAGYIAWILRGGTLASLLISSMPMWTGLDPLPLLAVRGRTRENQDVEKEARRAAEAAEFGSQNVEAFLRQRRKTSEL